MNFCTCKHIHGWLKSFPSWRGILLVYLVYWLCPQKNKFWPTLLKIKSGSDQPDWVSSHLVCLRACQEKESLASLTKHLSWAGKKIMYLHFYRELIFACIFSIKLRNDMNTVLFMGHILGTIVPSFPLCAKKRRLFPLLVVVQTFLMYLLVLELQSKIISVPVRSLFPPTYVLPPANFYIAFCRFQ